MHRNNRATASLIVMTSLLFTEGCNISMSEKERGNLAVAYSEMMIARNMAAGDSILGMKMEDSVLRAYGVEGKGEMMEKLKEMSKEPETLRAFLDSVQRRLELEQQGIDPDSAQTAPNDSTGIDTSGAAD